MAFQNKISTKQIRSIFYITISLIIIYILKFNLEKSIEILFFIALILLVSSIMNLFEESSKRYKILRAKDTGDYDSSGEEEIANYFRKKSIKFYLHPKIKIPKKIWIFDNPFDKRTLIPDFFLPQYNAFVEYWGMLGNEEYRKKSELKRKAYRENGIDFISLYEKDLEDKHKLDWNFTQKLLDLIREREGNNLEWRRRI